MSSACPRLGFEIRFHLRDDLSDSARLALWDDFVETLEARGLSCEGGGAAEWVHVVWRDGSQAEHEDREALVLWADGREEIERVTVGQVLDLDDAS
jgi:uncharacterized protein YggL (DUF469 family)